jgi:hypothetical protein
VRLWYCLEALAFGLTLSLSLSLINIACGHPAAPAAAEAAYGAELLRCVDKSPTRADADQCRAEVDAKWGVDSGAR